MKNKAKNNKKQTSFGASSVIEGENLSISSLNTSAINNLNERKKITIRDLCPEEKQKIGELLKKLAEEKEEKEKLKKLIEDEKKNLENKVESIIKEKESINNNNLNKSIYLQSESFMENFIPSNTDKKNDVSITSEIINLNQNYAEDKDHQIDMNKLKERFNNLFETLKKTAQNQEDYFSKFSNSITINDSQNISASASLLKEEKPQLLELKPITNYSESPTVRNLYNPVENYINNMSSFNPITPSNNLDNILQTSIININDEIKDNNFNNNLYTDSKLFNIII